MSFSARLRDRHALPPSIIAQNAARMVTATPSALATSPAVTYPRVSPDKALGISNSNATSIRRGSITSTGSDYSLSGPSEVSVMNMAMSTEYIEDIDGSHPAPDPDMDFAEPESARWRREAFAVEESVGSTAVRIGVRDEGGMTVQTVEMPWLQDVQDGEEAKRKWWRRPSATDVARSFKRKFSDVLFRGKKGSENEEESWRMLPEESDDESEGEAEADDESNFDDEQTSPGGVRVVQRVVDIPQTPATLRSPPATQASQPTRLRIPSIMLQDVTLHVPHVQTRITDEPGIPVDTIEYGIGAVTEIRSYTASDVASVNTYLSAPETQSAASVSTERLNTMLANLPPLERARTVINERPLPPDGVDRTPRKLSEAEELGLKLSYAVNKAKKEGSFSSKHRDSLFSRTYDKVTDESQQRRASLSLQREAELVKRREHDAWMRSSMGRKESWAFKRFGSTSASPILREEEEEEMLSPSERATEAGAGEGSSNRSEDWVAAASASGSAMQSCPTSFC